MSNNIYDILKKINQLEGKKESLKTSLTESVKACGSCGKPMAKCKCEDHKHESKKKDKVKESAIAEAVKRVEEALTEKYMGFKKTVAAIKKGGSAENPEAVAASIGRKKYGKEKFQKAAAAGKKLGEGEVEESGLQAYLGKKKYGEKGMQALQKAGREGKDLRPIRAKYDKMDEAGSQLPAPPDEVHLPKKGSKHGPVDVYKPKKNEDALTPKQQKFAKLAPPSDKITYADKIAGAKKGQKTEGNKFSGNLAKARAQGLKRADLDGDGDMEPVHEGWPSKEETEKRMKEKEGKTTHGKKTQTKSGTKHERDWDKHDSEKDTGDAKKGRGRPKKDKFVKK